MKKILSNIPRRIIALATAGFFLISPAVAAEINIAVASNFAAPIKVIIAGFEQQTDHRVRLILGSSGRFYAQITHGAPFHVFLSADQAKPEALELQGLILPHSRFTYAIGRLALWSAKAGLVTGNADILKQNSFNKLAMANPRLAPYGAAAREVLQSLGLYDALSPKLVQGENIAQTYQFVATGNADLGFVSLSQVTENGRIRAGSLWIIPDQLHKAIRQDAVILKSAENNPAARAFVRYLQSGSVREIIRNSGYRLAGEGDDHGIF